MKSKTNPNPGISRNLGIDQSSSRGNYLKRWLVAAALVMVAVGGLPWPIPLAKWLGFR